MSKHAHPSSRRRRALACAAVVVGLLAVVPPAGSAATSVRDQPVICIVLPSQCPPAPKPPPKPPPPAPRPPPQPGPPAPPPGPTPVAQPEVAMEDDGVTLYDGDGPAVVARWKSLGVDSVRVFANWGTIEPRRGRFVWANLDRAVAITRQNGLRVMLTLTSAGPIWASQQPRRRDPAYKPKPTAFASFALAVARRYRGRIARYLIGNEPNQRLFLSPQVECTRGKCAFPAADIYRREVNLAYPVIKRLDPHAQVIIGELAPIGSTFSFNRRSFAKTSLKPLAFLRAVACVDGRLHALRTAGCRGFRPLRGDGFGYHPYEIKNPPWHRNYDADIAKIGDLPKLERALDQVVARGRIRMRKPAPIYFTEFSYETSPPDPVHGVSLDQQSRYLQQAAYVVWLNRARVKLISQYGWRDDPLFQGRARYVGFQSGLLFANGAGKPALNAFATPFVIDTGAGLARARFWGQVRPGGSHTVVVRRVAPGVPVDYFHVQTDPGGYWSVVAPATRGAFYQYFSGPYASDALRVT